MPPQRSSVRVRVHPLGDTALVAELGSRLDTALNTRAIALAAALQKRRDVRRAMAGHGTVTVQFDPDQVSLDALTAAIKRLATRRPPVEEPGRLHRIPVVYDGPDLEEVARERGLTPSQVVEIHLRPIYRVFLVGFVPGWAYMGPLADELVLTRRATPRTQGAARRRDGPVRACRRQHARRQRPRRGVAGMHAARTATGGGAPVPGRDHRRRPRAPHQRRRGAAVDGGPAPCRRPAHLWRPPVG